MINYTQQKKSFIISIAILLVLLMSATSYAKYFYGSILLDKNEAKMIKEKLDLVVFPHWIHSMFFTCKSCHEKPYAMKKGSTEILMKEIEEGKKCGSCHNGTDAFSHKECKRCHSLSGEDAKATLKADARTKRLYPMLFTKKLRKNTADEKNPALKFADPKTVKIDDLKVVADRLGVKLNASYLTEKGFPKDRLKVIDWEKLLFKDNVVEPKNTVNVSENVKTRDNTIMFEVLSDFVDSVGFSHKTHSSLMGCKSCHENVFKSELGGNDVHMRLNAKGMYCGYCHSKVSFSLAECTRCHKYEKYKKHNIKGEVLTRKNPLKNKKMLVKNGQLIIGGDKSKSEIEDDNKTREEAKQHIKEVKEEEKEGKPLFNLPKKKEKKVAKKPLFNLPPKKKPKKDLTVTKKTKKLPVTLRKKAEEPKPRLYASMINSETASIKSDKKVQENEKEKSATPKADITDAEIEKPKKGGCLVFKWFWD